MRRLLVIAVAFIVCAARATLLDELICATNITFADTNVPDETPGVNPSYLLSDATVAVKFGLTDDELSEIYWVQIDTASVEVTPYAADHETIQGDIMTWEDLLAGNAIAVLPNKFTGCPNRGCDGFELATVEFLALWNSTAKYFLFSAILNFYGNSTTVPSSSPITLMTYSVATTPTTQTAPPTGSVLAGSVLSSVNLTATTALRNEAFGESSSSSSVLSAGAIAGIAVGGATVLGLLAVGCYMIHKNSTRDYTRQDGRTAGSRSVEMSGRYYGEEDHKRGVVRQKLYMV